MQAILKNALTKKKERDKNKKPSKKGVEKLPNFRNKEHSNYMLMP